MYTKCIQNVYKMYTTFRQTFVYIVYTKLKELWQLVLYTKCIQKFVKMWYTFCIQTVFIHFSYINSHLQKVYIIKIMYTIFTQNSYRMYIQIIVCKMNPTFPHILTRLLCTSLVNYCT